MRNYLENKQDNTSVQNKRNKKVLLKEVMILFEDDYQNLMDFYNIHNFKKGGKLDVTYLQ